MKLTLAAGAGPGPRPARAGFTLIEMLVSLAVVAVLLGLVTIGIRIVRRNTNDLMERQSTVNLQQGVENFKQTFGFFPPLVRKSDEFDTRGGHNTVVERVGVEYRINVYRMDRPASAGVDDETKLRTLPTLDPANPFLDDRRYSEYSLTVYLMGIGAGNASKARGVAGTDITDPIDGANGESDGAFAKPRTDGTFESVNNTSIGSGASKTNRNGTLQRSFVSAGTRSIQIEIESEEAGQVSIRNKNGGHYRYYRWLNGAERPVGSGVFLVDDLADYRVPRMVGRRAGTIPGDATPDDRDMDKNSALRMKNLTLRDSGYAIVSAGPNGVFGDEPIDTIIQAVGKNVDKTAPGEVSKLRLLAERDNIVVLGQP